MVVIVLDFQVIVRADCVQDDYVTKFKGGFHSYYTLFSSKRVTYSQVMSCFFFCASLLLWLCRKTKKFGTIVAVITDILR